MRHAAWFQNRRPAVPLRAFLGLIAAGAALAAGATFAAPSTGSSAPIPTPHAAPSEDATPGASAPTLFFLDIRARQVLRWDPGAAEPVVVVDDHDGAAPSVLPDGVVVDVERGHLYWTNMGRPDGDDGFLRRADLDGSHVETVVTPGGTHTPKQLALDPRRGKLYWSDREGMRIQRANLDGSKLETLVTIATGEDARADAANHAVGIALDVAGGWMYWSQKGSSDGGRGSLRRARLEIPEGEDALTRSDVEVLFAGLPEPIDLALDAQGGKLYWTDRGDDTVNRAPVAMPEGATAATRRDREILVRGVSEAIGITLDLSRGRLYYTGLRGQLGSARLDGSDARELLRWPRGLVGITAVDLP